MPVWLSPRKLKHQFIRTGITTANPPPPPAVYKPTEKEWTLPFGGEHNVPPEALFLKVKEVVLPHSTPGEKGLKKPAQKFIAVCLYTGLCLLFDFCLLLYFSDKRLF